MPRVANSRNYRLAPGGERGLTAGEQALAGAVFGAALDLAPIRLRRRKWFPFQPRHTVMAPCGHIHFHPGSGLYSDDFAAEGPALRGLFVHELVHVWQCQQRGRWWLPLTRHPFCRYDYSLRSDWPLERYGIEQQAELVRHAYFCTIGERIPDAHSPEILRGLLASLQQRT